MNKKGFTLIEIIIVIVILGVLATLSLPRLTAQIDASESAEAMQFFGVIKRGSISCYDSSGDFNNCNTGLELGVAVPAGARFSFYTAAPTTTEARWWARATRNTANYLMLQLNSNGLTQFATNLNSPFVGIVNKTGSTTASSPVVVATPF